MIIYMHAILKKDINVVEMTRYEYQLKNNNTAHLEDKNRDGFYLVDINVWLSKDDFHKYFKLNEN